MFEDVQKLICDRLILFTSSSLLYLAPVPLSFELSHLYAVYKESYGVGRVTIRFLFVPAGRITHCTIKLAN